MTIDRLAGQLALQVVAALIAAYIMRAIANSSPTVRALGL